MDETCSTHGQNDNGPLNVGNFLTSWATKSFL